MLTYADVCCPTCTPPSSSASPSGAPSFLLSAYVSLRCIRQQTLHTSADAAYVSSFLLREPSGCTLHACACMLTYADVCSQHTAHAARMRACARMPVPPRVCSRMLRCIRQNTLHMSAPSSSARMLAYARVCSRVLAYADVSDDVCAGVVFRCGLLTYADVC